MARVRQLPCGRWRVDGAGVTLPTEALARDYAREVNRERRCRWCRWGALLAWVGSVAVMSTDSSVPYLPGNFAHAEIPGLILGTLGTGMKVAKEFWSSRDGEKARER